tara:strand:- start:548 stop:958 length:411 start_codon:yes stop_codon:yes gene_type:complete
MMFALGVVAAVFLLPLAVLVFVLLILMHYTTKNESLALARKHIHIASCNFFNWRADEARFRQVTPTARRQIAALVTLLEETVASIEEKNVHKAMRQAEAAEAEVVQLGRELARLPWGEAEASRAAERQLDLPTGDN